MIIGLTGPAGAGKDTVADYLVEHHGFIKLSWARPLKQALAVMGFPEPANRDDKEKIIPGFDFSWRQAAQQLGTEFGRALDADIWVKIVGHRLRSAPNANWVISDCRFDNEAKLVHELGGTIWHLRGRQAALGEAANHSSENGIGDIRVDDEFIINDRSIPELFAHVDGIMSRARQEWNK